MDWPLLVAVVAVFASISTALSSSTRNEAHSQALIIQSLVRELSELVHKHSRTALSEHHTDDGIINAALAFEAMCNLKCDQIESTLQLLTRRCSRSFLFDANAADFSSRMTNLIARLRNILTDLSIETNPNDPNFYQAHAVMQAIYSDTNSYIGERFRPIIEHRF